MSSKKIASFALVRIGSGFKESNTEGSGIKWGLSEGMQDFHLANDISLVSVTLGKEVIKRRKSNWLTLANMFAVGETQENERGEGTKECRE